VNKLKLPSGGFYTEEIRERGERVGFKIITLGGDEAVLAHINFKTPQRVGKYALDLSGLETIGVDALCTAIRAREVVVIDEIGPMEIRSRSFCDAVIKALDADAPIIGTITARSFPFIDAIKKRPDITLIEVRQSNRDQLVTEFSKQFKA
jgi:nucleoside-triphosphatase